MRFIRRSGRTAGQGRDDAALRSTGDQPCSERGCSATNAVPCEYVDRRSRSCQTAWCPEHRSVVGGHVLCRRHAGTVTALPASASGVPLPDLDNRAPSLVSWVAREIDADVRALLQGYQHRLGGRLMADQTYLIFVGPERRRAWERAWKLATHGGLTLRLSLLVEEARDSVVVVKAGTRELAGITPPWILNRNRKGRVAVEDDATARAEFNERILRLFSERLAEEVMADDARQRQEHLQRSLGGGRG